MIIGHVNGAPVEEVVVQLVSAGVMTTAMLAVAVEVTFRRLRARLRRR